MNEINYSWMPIKAVNTLKRAGLVFAEDLVRCSRDELLTLRGMDFESMDAIEVALSSKGLSLKAESEGFLKRFLAGRTADEEPDRNCFVDKYNEAAAKALKAAGIYGKEDFTRFTEVEVRNLLGSESRIVADVKEALKGAGLGFRK